MVSQFGIFSNKICGFIEESLNTTDATLTPAHNGEEKAEDWLQVGKRNRTHVLRTVISKRIFVLLIIYFRMKCEKVLLRIYLLENSVPQCILLEIKNQLYMNHFSLFHLILK